MEWDSHTTDILARQLHLSPEHTKLRYTVLGGAGVDCMPVGYDIV